MGQAAARRRPGLTEVTFHKGPTRRYTSTLTRPDGAVVELEGGSWNRVGGPAREVPHDIAHLVVEHELGLDRGVFGVLVAGGLFRGARIAGGRRPPHAETRAAAVLAASVEPLNQAEVVVRAIADLALAGAAPDPEALRRACGERYAVDGVTREQIATSIDRLRTLGAQWRALAVGASLDLDFTARENKI